MAQWGHFTSAGKSLTLALLLAAGTTQAAESGETGANSAEITKYRQWVEEMKSTPRGPFKQVLWFCKDGSTQPPRPYACKDHGGGQQHGDWTEHTKALRENGYYVATLLAGVDTGQYIGGLAGADRYGQLLIQQYLIGADDGWVFRQALFYRGAIQEEAERKGARALLQAMAGEQEYLDRRYLALRSGVKLLSHGSDSASAQQVRQMSANLSDTDKAFMPLRAKIHGSPDAGDAQRVRSYAAKVNDEALAARYEALASTIDEVYAAEPLASVLGKAANYYSGAPWLQELLATAESSLRADNSAGNRFSTTATLLAQLRDNLGKVRAASARVGVIDLGLAVEAEHFRAATELRSQLSTLNRKQRLGLLAAALDASYGTGLLKHREWQAAEASLKSLGNDQVALGDYLQQLNYLGRVPGWATQNLRFFFQLPMDTLAVVEPKAIMFIQDQLRGSPLLFYSNVLDGLAQDGNRLAGVRHEIFGEGVGVGFNALNPGLARGTLHAAGGELTMENLDNHGIYLLPETVSDLPPIAGILTAGEGNPLSHVQLLARNLGIPNVAVQESMIPRLQNHDGKDVVMAVSPAGLVELSEFNQQWRDFFADNQSAGGVVIRPDLDKLDLSADHFISLDKLRAADSGRTVGPKAAKLGELRHAFPGAVAPGVAIPFGMFKAEVLDRPYRDSGGSIFDWMVKQYRALEAMPADDPARAEKTEAFRAELYQLILDSTPSASFVSQLKSAMQNEFGEVSTGVFVRSDTNVEDLPGFTGAGLNLTLPNVVGFDNLLAAIKEVWASPFTARAFAWRQSHMENPEHVYTSILLLRAVPSDKSGVLVTQDLDSGDMQTFSVAVNEGLGGAVDGQAAESLRVDTRDGSVRVMGTATASTRRILVATGGITAVPASGTDSVLQPAEIQRLIRFARDELPQRFPAITDDDGNPAAADVEFGFLNGELRLFQIRPFLESKGARGNSYLMNMDKSLQQVKQRDVNLNEVPEV